MQARKRNAKAADLHIVDLGIPYFPFPNKPLRNGEKHSTTHTLHIISPILDSIPTRSNSPNKAVTSAIRCTNKRVVAGTKIRDPSKVNRPASLSLPFPGVVDWSFFVTSKTVSDNPRSFRMTLKNPNNHAVTAVILHILKLFQHARIEYPAPQYSNRVWKLQLTKRDIGINTAGSWTCVNDNKTKVGEVVLLMLCMNLRGKLNGFSFAHIGQEMWAGHDAICWQSKITKLGNWP